VPEDEIRMRAYQKWEAAGRPDGDGVNFWLEAEREFLPPNAQANGSPRGDGGGKHLFGLELRGQTAIVRPVGNLRELDCLDIEAGEQEVLAFLDRTRARGVVLDLGRMDYSGSTALGVFVRLSRRVISGNGRMAACNVSEHEKEIFRLTHLDRLWPVYPSIEEAFRAVAA
jgi:anti-sigma B factor antagonist